HAQNPDAAHTEGSVFAWSSPPHLALLVGGALATIGITAALVRALTLSGGRRLSSPRTSTALVVGVVVLVAATGVAARWASTVQVPIATGPLAPANGPDVHSAGIVSSHAPGPCRPTSTEKAAAAKLVRDTELG